MLYVNFGERKLSIDIKLKRQGASVYSSFIEKSVTEFSKYDIHLDYQYLKNGIDLNYSRSNIKYCENMLGSCILKCDRYLFFVCFFYTKNYQQYFLHFYSFLFLLQYVNFPLSLQSLQRPLSIIIPANFTKSN